MTRARDLADFVSNADGDIKFDTDTLFIDSSANRVGIGTSTPASALHLESDTPAITLRDDSAYSAGTGPYVQFQGLDSGGTNRNFGQIYGLSNGSNSGELAFHTRNSGTSAERMRIDASGNLLVGATAVGVGTSASDTGIVARGSIGYLEAARDGGNPVRLNRQSSDGSIVEFAKDGSTVGSISSRGGVATNVILRTATGQGAGIGGANSGVLPCDEDGLQDNEINLGASGTRWKDLYLSGGIYIGGTTSANYITDYEQGTWTPVSPDVTLSGIATSTYTKIGRMVFVQAKFQFPTSSSGTTARVNGLPFTVDGNGTNSQYNLSSGEHTFGSYITCPVIPTTTILFRPNGGPSASYSTVSGKTFRLSGWYEI